MQKRDLPVPVRTTVGGPIDSEASGLSRTEAEVRRAAFRSIRGGRVPDAAQLAEATGVPLPTVQDAVGSLVRKGQAVVDGAGRSDRRRRVLRCRRRVGADSIAET